MKTEAIQGIGALMVILPTISAGLFYADNNAWPPLSHPRWIVVLVGLILLIGGRVLYEKELARRD